MSRRNALHRERQRDRVDVSMRLVPFPFQLWTSFAALDHACNAQAGAYRHQPPIAPALAQLSRRRQVLSADRHLLTPAPAKPVTILFRFRQGIDFMGLALPSTGRQREVTHLLAQW